MLFNFIATIVVGLSAAALMLLVFRPFGRKTPRWTYPAAAGAAMIAFTIYNEYDWFPRTVAQFPDHFVLGETVTSTNALQPWTFIVPRTDRFSLVNTESILSHPEAPQYRLAEIVLFDRHYGPNTINMFYDCAEPRQALASNAPSLAIDELETLVPWVASEPDDRLRELACDGAQPAS